VKPAAIFIIVCLQILPASAAEFVVVLDPGHSPKSPGAVSARGVVEVEFNDRLAAEVKKHIEAVRGIRVVLSRRPQEELGLKQRVERIHAADPDLAVSIHHDSVQPRFLSEWEHQGRKLRYSDRFSGFSLFVPTRGYYAEISRMAARRLADRLIAEKQPFSTYHAQKIPGESRKWVDSSRGIFAGDFLYLARRLRVPFLLLEAGVIVHREEEARLSDPGEVRRLAGHIATAVTGLKRRFESDRSRRRPPGPRPDDAWVRHPQGVPASPVIRWENAQEGLEFALVPVYFQGGYADRIALVRADPERFRVGVFFSQEAKSIADWQKQLGAAVVINSSFYQNDPLAPTTPILSDGKALGPENYRSSHGAFLAEPTKKGLKRFVLRDFNREKVDLEKSGYAQAVVSYPMLLDGSGRVRAAPNPSWRADRSFIAADKKGRIVLGTTEGGFFSLNRLGRFLKAAAGLELERALNLDGGPPACLCLKAKNLEYLAMGRYESNDSAGREIFFWGAVEVVWPLPGVIALFPREPGGK
jgi:N-acetylmuramoyl-L-alanine amidase